MAGLLSEAMADRRAHPEVGASLASERQSMLEALESNFSFKFFPHAVFS